VAALNEEDLAKAPRTARHRCQSFAGIRGDDPDFPPIYQRDPWCWSPEIGFHRSSRPDQPVTVRVTHRQRVVTKHAMRTWQAFRLGLGVGTSNSVSSTPASDVLTRPLEACGTWSGDLEPIAWYGYRCRDLTYVNDDEPARRAIYGAALRFFLPGGFGHWDEVLTRAADGSHSEADVSWANPEGTTATSGWTPSGFGLAATATRRSTRHHSTTPPASSSRTWPPPGSSMVSSAAWLGCFCSPTPTKGSSQPGCC
jgi:hypothetical protein